MSEETLSPQELNLEDVEQDIQKEELDRIQKREVEATTKTTLFVNVDTEVYNLRINGQIVRTLKPEENAVLPLFVATVGSKHLVDRILKRKDEKLDTNRDSPLRRNVFAKILPDLAEERKIKPLTPEQEAIELKKEVKRQGEVIKDFDQIDPKVANLEKEVEKLKKEILKNKGQKTTKE